MPAEWERVVAEDDPGHAIVIDGRVFQGMKLSVGDKTYHQIKAGYQCIQCLEPLDTAFPEKCPLCAFPMKERQAEVFAKVYGGYVPGLRTGPDWEAAADRLEDRAERRAFRRKLEKQGISVPTIIVPRDIH